MGYFSEMSLDMQEGRKPSATALTGENAFEEEESFDELPVPPVSSSSVQPLNEAAPQPGSDAASSVSAEMMEAPEDDPMEEDGGCDDAVDIKTDVPVGMVRPRMPMKKSAVPSIRLPKQNARLNGRPSRQKKSGPCRSRWTALPL